MACSRPLINWLFNQSRRVQVGLLLLTAGMGTTLIPIKAPPQQTASQTLLEPAQSAIRNPLTVQSLNWVNPAPGAVLTEWQKHRGESPVTGEPTDYCHNGLDMAAPVGSLIVAARDGVIAYSDWTDLGYGYLVLINHLDGTYTGYGHNSGLLVRKGDRVKAGQAIAKMGSTGYSSGSHLHFFWMAGKQIGKFKPGQSLPVNHLVHLLPIPMDTSSSQPAQECTRSTPKILALIK